MERAAFLVEETGALIPCLLNPETVVVRRSSAVRRAASASGYLTGADLGDDPLFVTGGGRTSLELDLLFDTSLVVAPVTSSTGLPTPGGSATAPTQSDVRDLTRPLWQLAENIPAAGGFGAPPLVRFLWATAWNILGVITAIAERVEQFGPDGRPNRSWVRLQLVRVSEPSAPPETTPAPPQAIAEAASTMAPPAAPAPGAGAPTETSRYEVVGGERVDEVAARVYGGRSWLWRLLVAVNDIDDPTDLPAGRILQIPPVPAFPEAGKRRMP